MKKLKYLLFIIPLFFIFVGNSKAYDIRTCGDTVINEEWLINQISLKFPDNDLTGYNYLFCYASSSTDYLMCYLFDYDINSTITYSSSSTGLYSFQVPQTNQNRPYYFYIRNSCTIRELSQPNYAYYTFYYYYPLTVGSRFFYSNFNISLVDSTVGSNLYNYKVLSLGNEEPEPEEPTIEDKIYLPDEIEEGNCPIILNKDTIRVYESTPVINTSINYTDYFINTHYIKQNGTETLTSSITCLDLNDFTTSYVYRNDFHQIIIIFLSIVIIIAYPLMKIIHAFFVGFKRR